MGSFKRFSGQKNILCTAYECYERLVRIHLVPTLGRIKLKKKETCNLKWCATSPASVRNFPSRP
jgi:hypothetical protein